MDQQRQEARRKLDDRFEVRLAGAGGQGLNLAGIILAEAAAIYDGLNAVQTQSYGPEARGGASQSEVIIARGEIDYPKVTRADLLLCMSQEACDRFYSQVRDDGLVVLDSSNVSRIPTHRAIALPITEMAEAETGHRFTACMVALGVISGLTDRVSRSALERSLRNRVPVGTEEMNLRALAAGFHAREPLGFDPGSQANG